MADANWVPTPAPTATMAVKPAAMSLVLRPRTSVERVATPTRPDRTVVTIVATAANSITNAPKIELA